MSDTETISIPLDQLERLDVVLPGRLSEVSGELTSRMVTDSRREIFRKMDESFDVITNQWFSRLSVTLLKNS